MTLLTINEIKKKIRNKNTKKDKTQREKICTNLPAINGWSADVSK